MKNQSENNNNIPMNVQKLNFDMDDARFRIRPYQQIASACSGALITSLFMTPLDVIKTRIQTQQKSMLSNKCFLYCNGLMDHICVCGPNGTQAKGVYYNGTIDAFVKISQNEGIKSLWSGLAPTLVLAIPATVIYFVCYEQLRLKYKEIYTKYTPTIASKEIAFFIPLLAGMSARILSVTVVNPLELVRTKMQSQKMSYFDVRKALKSMIGHEGFLGLWKGLGPTLYRDVPFSGIYWASYEAIKSNCGVINPSFWFSFVAGASAGSIAAIITTPFDVVKTHKQIEFGEKFLYPVDATTTIKKEKSSIQTLCGLYKSNGIKGLFSGITPRLAKVAPACAIMIASFEYGKAFFHKRNLDRYYQKFENNTTKLIS